MVALLANAVQPGRSKVMHFVFDNKEVEFIRKSKTV